MFVEKVSNGQPTKTDRSSWRSAACMYQGKSGDIRQSVIWLPAEVEEVHLVRADLLGMHGRKGGKYIGPKEY